MARQITILETNPAAGGQIAVRCALWFPVTAGQEVPRPGLVSACKGTAVPVMQEQNDLEAGKVVEEVQTYLFPDNTSTTAVKANLVAFYQRRAAYLATLPFQGKFYGVVFDGTTWSA